MGCPSAKLDFMDSIKFQNLLRIVVEVLQNTKSHVMFSVSDIGCTVNVMEKGFSFDRDFDAVYHFNEHTENLETVYETCRVHLETLLQ